MLHLCYADLNFCRQLYIYFSESNNSFSDRKSDISFMVFAGAKIIMGLLLIGELKQIVDFIEKKKPALEESLEE